MLINANILAFMAAILFAIGAIFFKINIIKKGDEFVYQLGLFFSGVIILWGGAFYFSDSYVIKNYLIPSVVIGVSLLCSNIFFMRSLTKLPIGIASAIANLNIVIIVLFSIYYYKEVVTNIELLGSFLIVIGLFAFAGNIKKYGKKAQGSMLILISATLLFMTIRNGGLKYTAENDFSNILIIWYSHCVAFISILLFVLLKKNKTKLKGSDNQRTTLSRGMIGGVFSAFGLLLYSIALEHGNASTIVPIFSMYLVMILPISRIFLKDKLTLLNYIAFSLVFVGTTLIII
ncbi:putative membrane protein [uncultured Candidatus Thioglobus sp.]|nr:putative membrane protein [uncultured Candidatus Thioglobus sp.]